ncbi:hypothetical protein CVT25_001804 [Psilocybe cyanescens]|uniref:Uncharacterized protein n=1 Tax=Psilocybe cyanescens TaxID=93625 RepID=A0A409X578_PSICY|nr:hypothetical protein CVT25_001804 [Psilocybe cyanescens]
MCTKDPNPGNISTHPNSLQLLPGTPSQSAPASGWPYCGYTAAWAPMYSPHPASVSPGTQPGSQWDSPRTLAARGGNPYHLYAQWTPGAYSSAFSAVGRSH